MQLQIIYRINYGDAHMPAKRLTDAFVRNVRLPNELKERQTTYIDTMERGLALMLVVSYGGTKTFRAMTYRNGKPVSLKLGSYPQLTVKAARTKAREYWEDPKRFEEKVEVGSFASVAENWFKRHVQANGLRSHEEIRRQLKTYVYPKWKDRPFLEIRRREVNDLLDYIADHHGRSQADAVLATIRSVMVFHQSRDENYTSPIVRGMRRNTNGQPRARILNDDELRAVWTAAGEAVARCHREMLSIDSPAT